MKKLYLLLFLCISQIAFPDSFIVKKDGSKTEIKKNSFRIDASEKTIYYKLANSEKEFKANFRDFDYVIFGVNKFKTFKLDKSNEISGFFVLAETPERTLVSISMPEEEGSSTVFYVFHVLDKEDMIIETHEFSNSRNQKNVNLRGEIYSKIKFYFPNCELLLNRLANSERNIQDTSNMAVLGFFNTPVYISCLQ
ncbi:hypothetical protein [Flavobacterium humi]|uniref:Uncharacterized protein n=1 Tax=Flavobacterium humi TaxID=2562683 RepID=A0A4Z0LAF5_9FLAO|nr:hypothetical protein [Flavobacterium humi]TGD58642.1 hypothetical protein E4635_06930 [Flavobacterium humi]